MPAQCCTRDDCGRSWLALISLHFVIEGEQSVIVRATLGDADPSDFIYCRVNTR